GQPPMKLWDARTLRGDDVLRRVPDRFGEVAGENALHGHDVRAEPGRMEVIALAGPLISLERDAMRAVVATESDIEAFEGDPLGLFGITLRLLDLGDEARVHPNSSTTRRDPAGAGHGDSMLHLSPRPIVWRVPERNFLISLLV